jgi:hypothetical protein
LKYVILIWWNKLIGWNLVSKHLFLQIDSFSWRRSRLIIIWILRCVSTHWNFASVDNFEWIYLYLFCFAINCFLWVYWSFILVYFRFNYFLGLKILLFLILVYKICTNFFALYNLFNYPFKALIVFYHTTSCLKRIYY